MRFFLTSIILIVFSALLLYFYYSLKVRELAVAAVKKYCKQLDVQLLDQSVSMHRLRLVKNPHQGLTLQQNYQFEFTSTGEERYRGKITMTGRTVSNIELQAHRVPEPINKIQ